MEWSSERYAGSIGTGMRYFTRNVELFMVLLLFTSLISAQCWTVAIRLILSQSTGHRVSLDHYNSISIAALTCVAYWS